MEKPAHPIPDQKQEFLAALDAYVLAMMEQYDRRHSTVPAATVQRWSDARANLSLTLDNLLDGVRS